MWSKNGSIPQEQTDGTDGWIEVPDMPVAPEGKEVVWWYPPGWVIRDPKPEGNWSWSQTEEKWIEIIKVIDIPEIVVSTDISALSSSDISALTTGQIAAL